MNKLNSCNSVKLQRQYPEFARVVVASAESVNTQHLAVFNTDPALADHKDHLLYRWDLYNTVLGSINKYEGGLENFAKGYTNFGVRVHDTCTTYREWVPFAQAVGLMGDFSDWKPMWLEQKDFGMWEISIPHENGQPAIPHNTRIKIKLVYGDGQERDLLPAHIEQARMEQGNMNCTFDGIMWNPEHKYQWRNSKPRRPYPLRVYECHIGMSSEQEQVATYNYFKDEMLPRISNLGYNAIQLMAVQEHPYYGSFGYHVSNPYAASSRYGTPEELKALVDAAHGYGLFVILDIVHSHACKNIYDGISGFDVGQEEYNNYFYGGARGWHSAWDSRIYNYSNWEVLRYLLGNLHYWLDNFQMDGFRFDGVTSMLYEHHGLNMEFSGDYSEYFSVSTNVDACVYLMLANQLIHEMNQDHITICEDVSGMPTLCRPVNEGGVGFDYRLGMGLPDFWTKLVTNSDDWDWDMEQICNVLTNRRYTEATLAYVECHDQSIVGHQPMIMQLAADVIHFHMARHRSDDGGHGEERMTRGIALYNMIRLCTRAIGGDGWLNFMGNEWGHPDWVDFPRHENEWSHDKCRRMWSLVNNDELKFTLLNNWDLYCNKLDQEYQYINNNHQIVSKRDNHNKVLVAERGPIVFVFNFHPTQPLDNYKVGVGLPGKYKAILCSDDCIFGGQGRVDYAYEHFTQAEGTPGDVSSNYDERPHSMRVGGPPRSVTVYGIRD